MLKIFRFLERRELQFMLLSFVVIIAQVWLDLRLPDYMSEITELVQMPNSPIDEIISAGMAMMACAFGSLFLTFIAGYSSAQIATKLSMKIRGEVYRKTLSFSMAEMNDFSTASLITRSTNDITQIQTFVVLGLTAFLRAPLMAFWAITKIAGKNMTFTMALGVTILALCIVIFTILRFAVPKSRTIQKLTDNINLVTREHLTGIRVVRAYNAEAYQEEKFHEANMTTMKTTLFVNRLTSFIQPYLGCIMSITTLTIYWLGAIMINETKDPSAQLTIFSDMVVFSSYAMQIVMSFMMLTMTLIMYPRFIVSVGRVMEILEKENTLTDGEAMTSNEQGTVEFKDVSFAYGGEEKVLENISFKVKKGETVAFIGSTGSGKSTLLNLVPRFYDCTEGEILVNGINVKAYNQNALRNILGVITQKAILFTGTVSSNVNYGNNGVSLSESEAIQNVERAIDIAQAKEFVSKIGLDAPVSQGGGNLSGGQKQRLSIARAIYRQPQIYMFDDSFSALDYKTDKVLRKELATQTADATKLIVAQRISTVKDADQIIVLDQGKIVGKGKHRNLLDTCSVYREIAESQLSKEELYE
ncbi:MAG: multidrug ABC transporter ATP-binding protein [Epulopiscium sp. Nele67-Bin005]|nr:MAG: multidrug ABC transporter ATP-binding protein [Epulopiscium sp. Nele67-Bin005]